MINNQIKQLIECRVIALATCSKEAVPNVVSVAFCKVIEENKVLITDNFMNKTRKNLLENNQVALAVWSDDMEEGYQLKGTAEYAVEGEYKHMVDTDPDNEGLAHKAAVLVTVHEIWDLATPRLITRE